MQKPGITDNVLYAPRRPAPPPINPVTHSQKEIGGRFLAPPRAREVPIDHTGWRLIDQ